MTFKTFPQAKSGIYDHRQLQVRYVVMDHMPIIVISKAWVDAGAPEDVSPTLKRPWGSFPDMPQKLTK